MTHPLPQLPDCLTRSLDCGSRIHCKTCRSPDGRDWRRSLAELCGGPVDWPCDQVPWPEGYVPTDEAAEVASKPVRQPRPTAAKPTPKQSKRAQRTSTLDALKRLGVGGFAWLKLLLRQGLAPDEIAVRRLKVCQSCPDGLYTPCVMGKYRCCGQLVTGDADSTSPGCGCVLARHTEDGDTPSGKLKSAREKCPRGHW